MCLILKICLNMLVNCKRMLTFAMSLRRVYRSMIRVGYFFTYQASLVTLCSWHTGISQILIANHLQSNKDVLRVCIYGCGVSLLHLLHTAWASCCQFLICGQCESLCSGTATMESRFFCIVLKTHTYETKNNYNNSFLFHILLLYYLNHII